MYIQIPAQIAVDSLLQDVDHVGAHHGYVVFETILADILHQFLEVVHLRHGDTSVHAIRVVGQLALAQIALEGRGNTPHPLSIYRYSRHGPRSWVPTVCADALLRSSAKVVVPVAQGSRTSRARLRAYMDTAPATSVSQAHGMSFSPSILMVTQAAQP